MQIKEVSITWRDEPNRTFYTLVAITEDKITDYSEADDDIFYYFTDETEYKDTLTNGTDEFIMEES